MIIEASFLREPNEGTEKGANEGEEGTDEGRRGGYDPAISK
jgi:hypothetical protein